MKLFASKEYLPPGAPPIPLLRPHWGNPEAGSPEPTSTRFDVYMTQGKHLFELTTLEACDAAVVPAGWEDLRTFPEWRSKASQLVDRAARAGKKTIIFFSSDLTEPIPLARPEDTIILRTSMTGSARRSNEFALPGWSEDLLRSFTESKIVVRPKSTRPSVGFCGLADPLHQSLGYKARRARRWTAAKVKGTPGGVGPALRRRALKSLAENPYVDTHFLIQDQFWGGTWGGEQEDTEAKHVARARFVENVLSTDYSLCVRGAGNFSYRLYEVLSCGRIPLFINTDCVLPYDFEVDWKEYCVWVEKDRLKSIAEQLVDFHSSVSPSEFQDLQERCRKVWEERISPLGFFSHLRRHLDAEASQTPSHRQQ